MIRSAIQRHSQAFSNVSRLGPCLFCSRASSNAATVGLYRILLRQIRALPETPFLLQPTLRPVYGIQTWRQSVLPLETQDKSIFKLFCIWNDGAFKTRNDSVYDWYKDLVGNNLEDEEGWVRGNMDYCLWTSREALTNAARTAFSAPLTDLCPMATRKTLAIVAVRVLNLFERLLQQSRVSMHDGLRVVATSSCVEVATPAEEPRYRYAYRIRVENLPDNDKTVQLLGRTWHIQEEDESRVPVGDPIVVQAPKTGVVGVLPVLHPGEYFEYMSGCELPSRNGTMSGALHMAVVPPRTKTALVGDDVDAFHSKDQFQLVVQPFPLIAVDGDLQARNWY